MLCHLEKQRLGALLEELLGCDDKAIRLTIRRELGLLSRYLRCKKYYARHAKAFPKRLKILTIALICLLGATVADAPDVDTTAGRDMTIAALSNLYDDEVEGEGE